MTKLSAFHFHPPVLAHRGASALAPENTLAAFKKAQQLGARWLEFDIMLTACGELVVFHDEDLARTTNGHGPLNQYRYDYLKTLDAGSWFSPEFAGEPIPLLQEVLQFAEEKSLFVNIEIKALPGQEEETILDLLKILASFKQLSPPLISSFSLKALNIFRQKSPQGLVGLLFDEWHPDWKNIQQELKSATLHFNQACLNPERLAELVRAEIPLLAYTVNDPARAKELFAWGLNAIFSDCPIKMLNLLA